MPKPQVNIIESKSKPAMNQLTCSSSEVGCISARENIPRLNVILIMHLNKNRIIPGHRLGWQSLDLTTTSQKACGTFVIPRPMVMRTARGQRWLCVRRSIESKATSPVPRETWTGFSNWLTKIRCCWSSVAACEVKWATTSKRLMG